MNYLLIFLIGLINVLLLRFVANKVGFLDVPNQRKAHKFSVPLIGGIFIIFQLILSNFIFHFDDFENSLIIYSLYICLIGLIDDKYNLNPVSRILVHIIIVYLVINKLNLYLSGINFGLFYLDFGNYKELFTILSVLFLMNSINYFDGIDGLAGSLVIISLLGLIFIDYSIVNIEFLATIIISLLIFLIFNFSDKNSLKIFLGDSGSTTIGFILSILILRHHDINAINDESSMIYAWIIILPIYEFLATNVSRFSRKEPIFQPGEDHIHFILIYYLKKSFLALISIILLAIVLILFGFGIQVYSVFSILFYFIFFIFYFIIREQLLRKLIKNN